VQPGESGELRLDNYVMGKPMEEPHIFEYTILSNDPVEPEKKITLEIDYVLQK